MIAHNAQLVRQRSVLEMSKVVRLACKYLVLATALLCCGAVPNTAEVQAEYESQIQEEATVAAGHHVDLRNKLRGSAHRRAGATVVASGELLACRRLAASASADHLGLQLSLGLAVPLRC